MTPFSSFFRRNTPNRTQTLDPYHHGHPCITVSTSLQSQVIRFKHKSRRACHCSQAKIEILPFALKNSLGPGRGPSRQSQPHPLLSWFSLIPCSCPPQGLCTCYSNTRVSSLPFGWHTHTHASRQSFLAPLHLVIPALARVRHKLSAQ